MTEARACEQIAQGAPNLRRCQFILLGDRGTCVWTSCPRMHPKAHRPGIEPATQWPICEKNIGGGSPTGKRVEAPQALTCNTNNTGVRIDPQELRSTETRGSKKSQGRLNPPPNVFFFTNRSLHYGLLGLKCPQLPQCQKGRRTGFQGPDQA